MNIFKIFSTCFDLQQKVVHFLKTISTVFYNCAHFCWMDRQIHKQTDRQAYN